MNSITPGYGNPARNEFHLKICFSTQPQAQPIQTQLFCAPYLSKDNTLRFEYQSPIYLVMYLTF